MKKAKSSHYDEDDYYDDDDYEYDDDDYYEDEHDDYTGPAKKPASTTTTTSTTTPTTNNNNNKKNTASSPSLTTVSATTSPSSGKKSESGSGNESKVLTISSKESSQMGSPASSEIGAGGGVTSSSSGGLMMTASPSSTASIATNASAAGRSPSTKSLKPLPKCELTEGVKAGTSGKTNLAVVFAGHVDHGKSTTVGHLLFQLGHFSEREVSKMEQLAKKSGKATFHFAWLLDQSDEERRRGVTIDSGVHAFETDHHAVSLLDAPGHEQFIENMASSSAQADVAVLVVSGKPDELAVGVEHQTKTHVQILRRLGVSSVIVAINKMDAVDYSKEAFENAKEAVQKLLLECKFKKEEISAFVPISGLAGVNLVSSASKEMPFYKNGPTLVEALDAVKPASRMLKFPLRFVVFDVQKETMTGKVECGSVSVGDSLLILPANIKATVRNIEHTVTGITKTAQAGDLVDIKMNADMASVVGSGNIACPAPAKNSNSSSSSSFPPCLVSSSVTAVIQTYGENARAILPGHKFVIMVNSVQVQGTIRKLVQKMNMQTGNWTPEGAMVKMIPPETQGRVIIDTEFPIAFERAEDVRQLGRFLLRQEGAVVGGGLIESIAGEKKFN